MTLPIYDSNEDRSDELSPHEIAKLEETLGSFRPRQPIGVDLSKQLSPPAVSTRPTGPWTLAATWFSGTIVGGLIVALAGPGTGSPEPAPLRPAPTPINVVETQQKSPDAAETVPAVSYESNTIERLVAGPWSDSNALLAGSHLDLTYRPSESRVRAWVSDEQIELAPQATPRGF